MFDDLYYEPDDPAVKRIADRVRALRESMRESMRESSATPTRADRVTACPRCGGEVEVSWENEHEYDRVCRGCKRRFSFAKPGGLLSDPRNDPIDPIRSRDLSAAEIG